MKIKDRIAQHFFPGISYADLMRAVFPEDLYPKAWRYSANGGPPGCAMAFGRALQEHGYWVDLTGGRRVVRRVHTSKTSGEREDEG